MVRHLEQCRNRVTWRSAKNVRLRFQGSEIAPSPKHHREPVVRTRKYSIRPVFFNWRRVLATDTTTDLIRPENEETCQAVAFISIPAPGEHPRRSSSTQNITSHLGRSSKPVTNVRASARFESESDWAY